MLEKQEGRRSRSSKPNGEGASRETQNGKVARRPRKAPGIRVERYFTRAGDDVGSPGTELEFAL